MADSVKAKIKSKKIIAEKDLVDLIRTAEKAKAGYDYPAALEIYEEALATLEKLSQKNGGDEKKLQEFLYEIHDGRAICYNWLAESNQEISALKSLQELAVKMGDEASRINVINRQAEAMIVMGELDNGIALIDTIQESANKLGDLDEQAQSSFNLANALFLKGEIEKSRKLMEQALEMFQESGNLAGQSRCLARMAFDGVRSGDTENIQENAEASLELARRAGDHREEAHSLNVLGIISNDISKTRDNYKLALEIFTTIGDENGRKTIANNLGLLFWRLGLYGQANYYATLAASGARKLENMRALAVSLDGVGRSWLELGNLERAEEIFNEGLSLSKEFADAFDIAACLMGLARIADKRGNYQGAIDNFSEQINLLKEKGDVPEIAVSLAWMGDVYRKSGDLDQADKTTSEAVKHLLSTRPNTDLHDQEVWWARYQVLAALSSEGSDATAKGQNEDSLLVLDKARETMLGSIATISDEGLRRNYLTKVPVNRKISEEWTKLFHKRPEFQEFINPSTTTGNLQEQFKRLAEIGTRLSTQRDPDKLPDFIMNEVVELNGAERAFLATKKEFEALKVVSLSRLSKEEADQIILDDGGLIDQAIDSRYAVLKADVGEIRDGEPPELNQRSVLVVPLVSQSQVLGVIYADLRRIFGSFNQNDIDLLTVLANQAASALESADWTHTLEEKVAGRTAELAVANSLLEEQNADLTVINEVQQALSEQLEFQTIIDMVGDKLMSIFRTQNLSIVIYDAETDMSHWPYTNWMGKKYSIDPTPLGGFSGHVIKTGRSLVINEDLEDAAKEFDSFLLDDDTSWPKSMAYVPIISEGKSIGMIGLSDTERENAYGAANVRLIESIAASLGIALTNVRLFDETNRRAADLAVINEVQQGLSEQLEFQTIIDLVGDKLMDIFKTQNLVIINYDPDADLCYWPYAHFQGRSIQLIQYHQVDFQVM
jgi:GAF domain-containing protein/tetratricopeptide (TPR) repeat protein